MNKADFEQIFGTTRVPSSGRHGGQQRYNGCTKYNSREASNTAQNIENEQSRFRANFRNHKGSFLRHCIQRAVTPCRDENVMENQGNRQGIYTDSLSKCNQAENDSGVRVGVTRDQGLVKQRTVQRKQQASKLVRRKVTQVYTEA